MCLTPIFTFNFQFETGTSFDDRCNDELDPSDLSENECGNGIPTASGECDNGYSSCDGAESDRSSDSIEMEGSFRELCEFLLQWHMENLITVTATEELIGFLGPFLLKLGCLRDIMPKKLVTIMKMFDLNGNNVTKFVVCGKCKQIYSEKASGVTDEDGIVLASTICGHTEYTEGPVCGQALLIEGKLGWKAQAYYYHRSLIAEIKKRVQEPAFVTAVNRVRDWEYCATTDDAVMRDPLDGAVLLKDKFSGLLGEGKPMANLAFGFNIDWFDPFDRLSQSKAKKITIF